MQQSQTIGVSILSGGCGGKIVYLDSKKDGSQDRFLRGVVPQTSKPASLAVTGGEGKASISDKL